MHPFVLVAVDQDQEFGQGKKVSIPQRQIFELPLNDTCKGTKYPNGVPIEGVKKRRYEKELRLLKNSYGDDEGGIMESGRCLSPAWRARPNRRV